MPMGSDEIPITISFLAKGLYMSFIVISEDLNGNDIYRGIPLNDLVLADSFLEEFSHIVPPMKGLESWRGLFNKDISIEYLTFASPIELDRFFAYMDIEEYTNKIDPKFVFDFTSYTEFGFPKNLMRLLGFIKQKKVQKKTNY